MSEKNYLDMPDDEVMSMSAPEPEPVAVEPVVEAVSTPNPVSTGTGVEAEETTETAAETGDDTGHNDDGVAVGGSEEGSKPVEAVGGVASDNETPVSGDVQEANKSPNDSGDGKTAVVTPPVTKSYSEMTVEEKAAAFDRMTAPFKANGRIVETRNVEEEIQLKQMGANFTQKMQVLQPQLRIIKMLENNDLLDESKLSHLIDLNQKKPQAIQKLLADAEFDPLSADKDQAAGYTPGNYQVSDQEMAFQTALDTVEITETGSELILEIARQYDQESKQALYQNPDLVVSLNQQRANGIYAQINDEVQRLKALGQIGPQVPYLQAYFAVGDMLHTQGKLVGSAEKSTEQVPVETRTQTPNQTTVVNEARAQAAAPTRATATPSNSPKNSSDILNLPDEEFLKVMHNRV